MREVARVAWTTFRGWRWWMQALLALAVISAAVTAFSGDGAQQQVAAAGDATEQPTSSTSIATTTTARESTTTTLAESPEGGLRSAPAELADGPPTPDELVRDRVVFEDLALLDALGVAPESDAATYERARFPHWDDVDGDGCDTRCEVLSSQRLPDGSWFSEWDGATEVDTSLVHIDHVVALAEAWRSGASTWSARQRDDFADDRINLLAVTAASNQRKRDHDAARWFPSRSAANCLWARTVVVVKEAWSLSVDPAEKDALRNLLTSCGAVPPTTTTAAAAPPTTVAPAPPPPAAPSGDCTPGYSPCLPPASDYDCQGGSGNGPAYTGRVSVDHAHGDPYDLDRDGDGVGCDS